MHCKGSDDPMKKNINRREFLKFFGLFSFGAAAPNYIRNRNWIATESRSQNVLIIVFDTFSAWNMSLYGYLRQTTPNIDRLADKAIVYHKHFASSNFTTPGTASLLTGAVPWNHRALKHGDLVADNYEQKNIFNIFSQHHKMAYSHNILAENLLQQFSADIDDLTPRSKLFLQNDGLVDGLFSSDHDIATVGWYRGMKSHLEGHSYSLLLSRFSNLLNKLKIKGVELSFPRGLPYISGDNTYILEDGIDWVKDQVVNAPKPYFGYYHFLPPHFPYNTRQEFFGSLKNDGYQPVEKPDSIFKTNRAEGNIDKYRQWYDEYILYVDAEFGRLYEYLSDNGFLNDTLLVLTSDHGEMFERGIVGHQTSAFYQPLLHIPLLIFAPNQTSRIDVFDNTSAVDVLATLAFLTGQNIPDWSEGLVLPPFNTKDSFSERDIFAIRAKHTDKDEPILRASAMIARGPYKLTYMYGYDTPVGVEDMVELYNLEDDPEELTDLSGQQKNIVDEMLGELINQIEQSN